MPAQFIGGTAFGLKHVRPPDGATGRGVVTIARHHVSVNMRYGISQREIIYLHRREAVVQRPPHIHDLAPVPGSRLRVKITRLGRMSPAPDDHAVAGQRRSRLQMNFTKLPGCHDQGEIAISRPYRTTQDATRPRYLLIPIRRPSIRHRHIISSPSRVPDRPPAENSNGAQRRIQSRAINLHPGRATAPAEIALPDDLRATGRQVHLWHVPEMCDRRSVPRPPCRARSAGRTR